MRLGCVLVEGGVEVCWRPVQARWVARCIDAECPEHRWTGPWRKLDTDATRDAQCHYEQCHNPLR